KEDYKASMGLLMTWLSQSASVPLMDREHSFHQLALRWLLDVCSVFSSDTPDDVSRGAALELVVRFFDALEANAEDHWQVPRLDVLGIGESAAKSPAADEDDQDSTFQAAYEGMTYKDTTDDDVDAEVLDIMPQK